MLRAHSADTEETMGLDFPDTSEDIRQEQAATEVQAAFRGYLVVFFCGYTVFLSIPCQENYRHTLFIGTQMWVDDKCSSLNSQKGFVRGREENEYKCGNLFLNQPKCSPKNYNKKLSSYSHYIKTSIIRRLFKFCYNWYLHYMIACWKCDN